MIVVTDSGGTKLEWRALKLDGTIKQGRTAGFHPLFSNKEDLETIAIAIKNGIGSNPDLIYYYGAGYAVSDQAQLIETGFHSVFKNTEIRIQNDLLGVARALCGNQKGIACILGTGSNSCYYDGLEIKRNIPPLGYILGDEGSGTALGKKLLKAFCRDSLPKDIRTAFDKRYNIGMHNLIEKIYQGQAPNQFIAGFSKFLLDHRNNPSIFEMIKLTFKEFIDNILLEYECVKQYPIHFSGSIAFYFNDILRQVLNDYHLTVGNIVETPIAGLALYHQKELRN